jgi:hypothetical protein
VSYPNFLQNRFPLADNCHYIVMFLH